GLHPTSVEFHRRWAQTSAQLFNLFRIVYLGVGLAPEALTSLYGRSGADLLRDLGRPVADDELPEILTKFFTGAVDRLSGPLVEDGPPSETEPLRPALDNGDNYLRWLIDAASASHDRLRRQEGFSGERPPRALLYLLLQHALDLAYVDTAVALKVGAGVLDAAAARRARL